MSKRIRLYEIYPAGRGFSAQSSDYHGVIYKVAAVSIRQAYFFAGNYTWATDPNNPIGLVEVYNKHVVGEGWHHLWDDCRIHGGVGISHGDSRTRIASAMRQHRDSHA